MHDGSEGSFQLTGRTRYKLILGCMFLSSCISSSLCIYCRFLFFSSEIVLLIHKYTHEKCVHMSKKTSLLSFNPLYFIAVNIFPIYFLSGSEPIFEFKRSHFVCWDIRADKIADVKMKRFLHPFFILILLKYYPNIFMHLICFLSNLHW